MGSWGCLVSANARGHSGSDSMSSWNGAGSGVDSVSSWNGAGSGVDSVSSWNGAGSGVDSVSSWNGAGSGVDSLSSWNGAGSGVDSVSSGVDSVSSWNGAGSGVDSVSSWNGAGSVRVGRATDGSRMDFPTDGGGRRTTDNGLSPLVSGRSTGRWELALIFIYCRNLIYLTYGKMWLILYIV